MPHSPSTTTVTTTALQLGTKLTSYRGLPGLCRALQVHMKGTSRTLKRHALTQPTASRVTREQRYPTLTLLPNPCRITMTVRLHLYSCRGDWPKGRPGARRVWLTWSYAAEAAAAVTAIRKECGWCVPDVYYGTPLPACLETAMPRNKVRNMGHWFISFMLY